MQEKVRIGIIGVGGIALWHINNILGESEFEIAGLADVNPEAIKKAKEGIPGVKDVPEFSDYREMIKSAKLDAVQINTPHTLHFEHTMDCLDAGLHVLLEKPMVCCVDHAKAIIEKAEQVGKVMMVSYQRHFSPQFRYIKNVIETGELGEINFVAGLLQQPWSFFTGGTWRQKPELSGGGMFNDSGSHMLDVILWTTGLAVKKVYANIDNCGTSVDVNSSTALEFENGAQGTLSIMGNAVIGWYEDLTIAGTKGIIYYRNGKLSRCNGGNDILEITDLPESCSQDRGFLDAILGRDINWAPPTCGLRVVELTEAAYESAKTGQPCTVKHS